MFKNERKITRRKFLVDTAAAAASVGMAGTVPCSAYADPAAQSHISCDVLVCGATPAVIAAAVTAARNHRSV